MPAAIERLNLPDDVDLVVSLSHAVAKSVRARGNPCLLLFHADALRMASPR